MLFFKPLLAVMAERQARTAGARKAAEVAQAAAAEKVKQYQEALQKARAQVYSEQEAARKKLLDERAAQLKEARGAAGREVAKAKERIASELEAAKGELQASTGQLAAEIARRVLQGSTRPGSSCERGSMTRRQTVSFLFCDANFYVGFRGGECARSRGKRRRQRNARARNGNLQVDQFCDRGGSAGLRFSEGHAANFPQAMPRTSAPRLRKRQRPRPKRTSS